MFLMIFLMFVNKEVCEIVLILSGSTDKDFFAAIFVFTIIMRYLDIYTGKGMVKEWWSMVFTPDK